MFRWWAFWRRVQYGAGFLILLGLISTGVYFKYFYTAPSCFDRTMNGEERGVDCGGVCTRMCALDVLAPKVTWVESFKIVDGQYNVVAYIENRNATAGTPEIGYTFSLYDNEGFITRREGKTFLPLGKTYPIFEGRIATGSRVPTRTELVFNTEGVVWLPLTGATSPLQAGTYALTSADSLPKLVADIQNTSLDAVRDVEVIATIFDSERRPLTVSRTVASFERRSSDDVTFTWPSPIATTLKSCEVPTDVVLAIDLSGSMNSDSIQPPEPLTSVLSAAKSFASRLKSHDQIGLVTYATTASIIEQLTNDATRVGNSISALTIDPKEETGSTNTGEALMRMTEVLSSAKHNEDARKVAILLTDGLATAPQSNPDAYAVTNANALKETGTQLFTVGIGTSLNEEFLQTLASSPAYYYKAPSVRDIDSIYTSITEAICEDGPTIIDIIPKIEPQFPAL